MTPHAFIAMPFGTKPGADGAPIHFDRIRAELIDPALKSAGCEPFRADDEARAGDIRADMFQELLVADIVVVDLTIDNPNVWYELGVRHALRARGAVLVQGPRATQPFDVGADRKLVYHLSNGAPDPAFLNADIAALAAMLRATVDASAERMVSPVYQLLDHLQEPPWRDLLLAQRNEFSAAQQRWASRIEIARQKGRAGDILVLADETPTQALWIEGRRAAGEALLKIGQPRFALEQFDAALAVEPLDKRSRERRALCLGRVGRHAEAREAVAGLLRDHASDPEVWALAGRVEKAHWVSLWRTPGDSGEQWRAAAALQLASLDEAIVPYHQAFIADPSHHHAGINSLTLHMLMRHLGGEVSTTVIDNLTGGVLWAALSAGKRAPKDYWARASFAELCLLVNPVGAVQREFASAVAAAAGDRFALDSTRQTLELLRDLAFRPAETAAALAIVEAELLRLVPREEPRQVLLFSGHMVDAPGRELPRFPAAKVPLAAAAIERALDELGAGAPDLAITQGACGGDLLFAEGCLARGVRVLLMQPLPEPEFVERSVLACEGGEAWRARYYALRARLPDAPLFMGEELGPVPKNVDQWERCNQWMLHTALAAGIDRVRFLCLWDGGGGDGPGGTRHSVEEVKRRTGRITWLDTRVLFGA